MHIIKISTTLANEHNRMEQFTNILSDIENFNETGWFYGTIQQLRHAVVAPTGVGKNDGSMMHRGGW